MALQIKRGIAKVLKEKNIILSEGQLCYETDTLNFKIGDGVSTYSSLPYFHVKNNMSATTDPVETDLSYSIGSLWFNQTSNCLFICKMNDGSKTIWSKLDSVDEEDLKELPKSTRLQLNTDLNNIKKEGFYYCPLNADAKTMKNLPLEIANSQELAFSLLVEKHAGCKQTFTVYLPNKPKTFIRNYYDWDKSWGEWYKFVFSNEINMLTQKSGIKNNASEPPSKYKEGLYFNEVYNNDGFPIPWGHLLNIRGGTNSSTTQLLLEWIGNFHSGTMEQAVSTETRAFIRSSSDNGVPNGQFDWWSKFTELWTNPAMKALLQPNGYIRFPNGFTIQWGVYRIGYKRKYEIKYPIAFSQIWGHFTNVLGNENLPPIYMNSYVVNGTSFVAYNSSSCTDDVDFYWFAIGYIV